LFAGTTNRSSKCDTIANGKCDAIANGKCDAIANGKCDAIAKCDTIANGKCDAIANGKCDAIADSNPDGFSESNGRWRCRSHTDRCSNSRNYRSGAHGWHLLRNQEDMSTQRTHDRYVEVNKHDVYSRILELDLRKMEKRHERHIWHIKSMWGGVAGILLAVYVLMTAQYLNGNALLVRSNNYILAGGTLLLSIALCYGLMWIGVIREYKKFERVINDKIRYYENIINVS
jgi:hypothetical protein